LSIKSKVIYLLKKLVIGIGFTSFLLFISIFQNVGYSGSTYVNRKDITKVYIPPFEYYGIVKYAYNITYNPFLFPLTWLSKNGYSSGSSSMVILPESLSLNGPFVGPQWPSTREIREEALMNEILPELAPNFLILFVLTLIIEYLELRSLFFCWLGGIVGFTVGGVTGTLIGFLIVTFIVFCRIKVKNRERIREKMKYFKKGLIRETETANR